MQAKPKDFVVSSAYTDIKSTGLIDVFKASMIVGEPSTVLVIRQDGSAVEYEMLLKTQI